MDETQPRETGVAPVNGAKLYYEIAGSGRPLVLLHAGLMDCRMWDDQFSDFAQHYRVIRYDLRGYGKSDWPAAPYAHEEDLRGLLQFLGIQKATLMGVSLGGRTALDFALHSPEMVEALIPVAAGVSGYQWPDSPARAEIEAAEKVGDIGKIAELLTRIWVDGPNRAPDEVDARIRERVKAMTTEMLSRSNPEPEPPEQELQPPALSRLHEIQAPTLILVGALDVVDILVIANLLQRQIPHARTLLIPGAAHMVTMEEPGTVNQAVRNFLQ